MALYWPIATILYSGLVLCSLWRSASWFRKSGLSALRENFTRYFPIYKIQCPEISTKEVKDSRQNSLFTNFKRIQRWEKRKYLSWALHFVTLFICFMVSGSFFNEPDPFRNGIFFGPFNLRFCVQKLMLPLVA